MKIIDVVQGDSSWHAHRSVSRNASDAPAVMGASPYVSRAELIRRKATGIEVEHDAATLARFARGHEVEPALRALAERMIGEDLFPVVGVSDDGYLSASFDGVSMAGSVMFEAKQANAGKFACIDRQEIPPEDFWQIVQQFAVCETAQTCLYLVGDGSDSTARLEILRSQIEAAIPKLRAAWAQFDQDVQAYVTGPAEMPVAKAAVESLPAVSVQVNGTIAVVSNLGLFGEALKDFIARIDMKPETDQAFAAAEAAVKTLEKAQEALEAAKASGLAQVATVDQMVRTVDSYAQLARTTRLALERMVKARKDEIRIEIVNGAVESLRQHYAAANVTLGEHAMGVPASARAELAEAIKGKKTVSSVRDSADTALARLKIEASQRADAIRICAGIIQGSGRRDLFPDAVQLCASKAPEDLKNLVSSRIAQARAAEEARLESERAKIRAEEEAKARRKAEANAEADRERIRQEDRAMAQQEAAATPQPTVAPTPPPEAIKSASATAGAARVAPQGASVARTLASAPKPTRPTDAQLIEVLALHYRVHESKVIEWLLEVDLEAASKAMAEAI